MRFLDQTPDMQFSVRRFDTSDISIPSSFISNQSYQELMRIYMEIVGPEGQAAEGKAAKSYRVVLSKDELLEWCVQASRTIYRLIVICAQGGV